VLITLIYDQIDSESLRPNLINELISIIRSAVIWKSLITTITGINKWKTKKRVSITKEYI
jgi:hypothetical protein